MYTITQENPFPAEPIELAAQSTFVNADPIPGYTDDELMHDAEKSGQWDRLAYYGYATAEMITMSALRHRFEDQRLVGRPSDERMFVVEKFVEAIWDSKREIPTVSEYASELHKAGLLNTEEASLAGNVQHAKDLDEDEAWSRARLRNKLEFYLNAQPAAVEGQDIKQLADEYAFKLSKAKENPRHADAARKMLLEARGLSSDEIEEAMQSRGRSAYIEWRSAGVPAALAQQMAENPRDTLFGSVSVDGTMRRVLHGDLDTQLAVRKYLGVENFYAFLEYQARADAVARSERLSGQIAASAFSNALARGDDQTVRIMQEMAAKRNAQQDQGPNSVFELPIYSAEERSHFESMAIRVAHEPVLRKHLAYFTENALQGEYQSWIARSEAAE